MVKSKFIAVFVALCGLSASYAQDSTLTFTAFLERVRTHHPTSFRADIVREQGAYSEMQARGAFDPTIGGDVKQKYFDDKQYYSSCNGYLKVPTWYGISFETGYQQASGTYLNPSDRTPDAGLLYAGINLELGRGLIIDQRRAELMKSKLIRKMSEQQQRIMLNELLGDAANAYWRWSGAYQALELHRLAVEAARSRLSAVESYVEFGDLPELSVTEATAQYQSRMLALREAELQWSNSTAAMELFLWEDGYIPLETEGAVPEVSVLTEWPSEMQDSLILTGIHPLIENQGYTMQMQEVELKLKKEYLKPKLTLKYRALNEPVGSGLVSQYSLSDYSWGAGVEYSILTRRERAEVALGELKLRDSEMKQVELTAKIEYQIITAQNKIAALSDQLEAAGMALEGYRQLLKAETDLFESGESSLFMVNARELSVLESRLKLIDFRVKLAQSVSDLKYVILLSAQ